MEKMFTVVSARRNKENAKKYIYMAYAISGRWAVFLEEGFTAVGLSISIGYEDKWGIW